MSKRRKRRRETKQEMKERSSNLQVHPILLDDDLSSFQKQNMNIFRISLQRLYACMKWVLVCVAIVTATYYGYKGLLRLSDWMNQLDTHRQRSRYRASARM